MYKLKNVKFQDHSILKNIETRDEHSIIGDTHHLDHLLRAS